MSQSEDALLTPKVDDALVGVYELAVFVAAFPRQLARGPTHASEIVEQCYEVGVRTLPLVLVTGAITGVVFTQQSRPSLEEFGATSWLPSLVTVALVRSMAPLVTALVCAGRTGSSIGAELGSMRVSEQIDAMEVSAINPYNFLVLTRTIATTLMVPVLTLFFALVAFLTSYANVLVNEGLSWQAFVLSSFSSIDTLDLVSALARSVSFGFTIGVVSCFSGFHASRGTAGVGRAANQAVVRSMLAVFVLEILMVQVITLVRSLP